MWDEPARKLRVCQHLSLSNFFPNFNAVMIPDDVDLVDVDAIFERNPVLTAGDAGDIFLLHGSLCETVSRFLAPPVTRSQVQRPEP